MNHLKIAVLGAGSFVFGPSVLRDAIVVHRLANVELALMDIDLDTITLLAGVGHRMAQEVGVHLTITVHKDRKTALDGAAFVICSAARQLTMRFATDVELIREHYPDHLITEFGGVAGIAYSLRQIALMEEIAADIKEQCPSAQLLNVSNPLPRVCQALHELGVNTVGLCCVSMVAYDEIQNMLEGYNSGYPFEEPRKRYEVTIGGVNHFTWVTAVHDRKSHADLMPTLRSRAAKEASPMQPLTWRMLKETGFMLASGDSHIGDFLRPGPEARSMDHTSHGSADDRVRRKRALRDMADGRLHWESLVVKESWEKPFDLIASTIDGKPRPMHSLNLINTARQIPQLPAGVFVETPATATADGPVPDVVELPPVVAERCQQAAEVTDTIVRAALGHSLSLVAQAVELDPTIVDKEAGLAALSACITAHQDVLPPYEN